MQFEEIDIENNSKGQAIKIPDQFKINDSKVYIRKMGNGLYIIPYHTPWQSLFESLEQFSEDFMDERNQTIEQKRDSLDL
ncbi:MAG TPA: type II toxin-antitoxin system VapB family antitoxin [Hanamia sp.]